MGHEELTSSASAQQALPRASGALRSAPSDQQKRPRAQAAAFPMAADQRAAEEEGAASKRSRMGHLQPGCAVAAPAAWRGLELEEPPRARAAAAPQQGRRQHALAEPHPLRLDTQAGSWPLSGPAKHGAWVFLLRGPAARRMSAAQSPPWRRGQTSYVLSAEFGSSTAARRPVHTGSPLRPSAAPLPLEHDDRMVPSPGCDDLLGLDPLDILGGGGGLAAGGALPPLPPAPGASPQPVEIRLEEALRVQIEMQRQARGRLAPSAPLPPLPASASGVVFAEASVAEAAPHCGGPPPAPPAQLHAQLEAQRVLQAKFEEHNAYLLRLIGGPRAPRLPPSARARSSCLPEAIWGFGSELTCASSPAAARRGASRGCAGEHGERGQGAAGLRAAAGVPLRERHNRPVPDASAHAPRRPSWRAPLCGHPA